MDYDYLQASNGSGDAALMHITADRLTGATTIAVDSVANVPSKFIATYGTLDANGYITAASKREFRGHESGGSLIIETFEPGYTDAGNTAGQVVVIRPTSGWANDVARGAKVGHKNDGTHKDDLPLLSPVITTPKVITAFMDLNGNELFKVAPSALAVNELTVANAAAGGAPSLTASGGDTDVSWAAKGKGAGKFLPQLPIFSGAVAGGVIGTTETVVATITVPAQPVATTMLLTARAFLDWPTGAPSWVGEFRLRDTNVSGTELAYDKDTKSEDAGVNNTGHSTIIKAVNIAANTAKTFVLTFKTDANVTNGVTGTYWAIQGAQ